MRRAKAVGQRWIRVPHMTVRPEHCDSDGKLVGYLGEQRLGHGGSIAPAACLRPDLEQPRPTR